VPGQVSLFKSIFTLGVAQLLSLVGAVVVTVLLPRFLGDVNLGKLAYAAALTSLFGLIADLGTMTYLTKQVARDPSQATTLTVSAILTRIPLGLGAALFTAAIVNVTNEDETTRAIVYVLSAGMIAVSIGNTLGAALQGLQRMRALALSMVAGKLLYALLVAALLFSGFGPVEVAMASLVSSLVGATVGTVALGRMITTGGQLSREAFGRVLFGGIPFFIWQAALVVYGQIDFVMLSFMTSDAVVGWYAAAYRIVMIPVFFPTTVVTAAFPALSATAREPDAFRSIADRSLRLLAITTLPMAFGILVLPDKLIQVLGYPGEFSNSVVPIILLALHMPLAGIDMVLGTMLTALDRQRTWAFTGIAAAILNPALNLAAIPLTQALYGNGAIGAAGTTTVTEIFMFAVGLRLLPRGILGAQTFRYIARCTAAAIVMAVTVWAARAAPLYLVVLLGAGVYVLLALAFRIISMTEVREFTSFVRRQRSVAPTVAAGQPTS
jgi:O-antigen/teichoic acid export membrane protein